MGNVWKKQVIAAGVGGFNEWKKTTVAKQIDSIIHEKLQQQALQDNNFEAALGHMMKMRQFLSAPNNILGSEQTKHGEIAEHLDVNVRNAWSILNGQTEVATFNGVGRTAPEDFILNGIKYQSKFINGTNNTLSHIIEHFEKYHDKTMNYSIPKDQYQMIESIRNGHIPDTLNDKSVRAIISKVEQIERESGRSFSEMVEPSISSYEDVQLGEIPETVSKHQEEIVYENQKLQDKIENEEEEKLKIIEAKKGPSIGEGLKVAGTVALVGAAISSISGVYSKVKSGKKIEDFNNDDWKEIGLDATKAGGKSGFAAASIYALTNLTSLSAPFAGAVTAAAMGITSLIADQRSGQIEMDEFVRQGQILCIEAGIAAIGGAVGQTLIPVPVLGSIIGLVTTNLLWELSKGKLGKKEEELKLFLNDYSESLIAKIDQAYNELVRVITQKYAQFDSLIEAAFDVNANVDTLAASSVELAREFGVDEKKILKDDKDLEAFFIN